MNMNHAENGGGCGVLILAVIVIAVMALVLVPGLGSQTDATRRLEAQERIATANAQEAQARVQQLATLPLVVASVKDSALVVWYAARDAGRETLYAVVIALLVWRLMARKAEPPVVNTQTEFRDGDSL